MQQSERLESLGRLVGGVAHDFNNLLNVITGYAELIGDDVAALAGEDDAVRSVLADIGEIRTAAERAARLTAQLLVFARRDVIHPVALDVSEVARGVEQLLRRTLGEHIELIISSDPGLWPVTADPGQLEQVLVNLAVNARDAMPSGGKLIFDSQNITVDEAYPADGQSPLSRAGTSGCGCPTSARAWPGPWPTGRSSPSTPLRSQGGVPGSAWRPCTGS